MNTQVADCLTPIPSNGREPEGGPLPPERNRVYYLRKIITTLAIKKAEAWGFYPSMMLLRKQHRPVLWLYFGPILIPYGSKKIMEFEEQVALSLDFPLIAEGLFHPGSKNFASLVPSVAGTLPSDHYFIDTLFHMRLLADAFSSQA